MRLHVLRCLSPVIEESAALARFGQLSSLEASPKMRALLRAASDRELPHFADDVELTLGAGRGNRTFVLNSLPSPAEVPWDELSDIPTALVTGSNGKTTTVRLVAACAQAHGWRPGYNCTDGCSSALRPWQRETIPGPPAHAW